MSYLVRDTYKLGGNHSMFDI